MIQETVFYLIGGLGLFLFGMRLMYDGLRAAAGQKLLTKRPQASYLNESP